MLKLSKEELIKEILCGTLTTVIIALFAELVFTIFVWIFGIGDTAVKIVNQIVKIISIGVGVYLFVKRDKGLYKGALIGLLGGIVCYILFTLISGGEIGVKVVWEILLSVCIGAIFGAIRVNRSNNFA